MQTSTSNEALGNRRSEIEVNGHTSSFVYDSLKRSELTTSHEGVTTSQTYNVAGWVLTRSDGLGHTTTNTYEVLGQL